MKLRALALAMLLALGPATAAEAALPPEAYEQLRQTAQVALVGVVQQDDGGRVWLRVEQVLRGPYAPGQTVPVLYPENRGQEIPAGADIYYNRFAPGLRLRVFARPQDPSTLAIVPGGIDVMGQASPPPKSGGCGGCAIGEPHRGAAPLALAALSLAALLRARAPSRRRPPAPRRARSRAAPPAR